MNRPIKRRISPFPCLIVLLTLGLPFTVTAQDYLIPRPPSENIIIKNVLVPDRSGEVQDVNVTLRIKDGVLDLVTKDTVPAAESDLILNADNGVLLGDLNLERVVFEILIGNVDHGNPAAPREQSNVDGNGHGVIRND